MARGVAVAPVVLHAGVSSPELHEPPAPERCGCRPPPRGWWRRPAHGGGRVVAVGTTVVRALESAVDDDGEPVAARADGPTSCSAPTGPPGWWTGSSPGLHPPEASHLLLLEAVAGRHLVEAAYAEAVAARYRWHEFGDSMLLLP